MHKIVVSDDFVAVVGDHMWAAKKGLDALAIDWDEGPNAHISSIDIWRDLRAASDKDGAVAKTVGDIAKGLATGDRLDAAYELPFLAHATMEPINATVHVTRSVRDLDRHASHDPGAVGGGEGGRSSGREGDRQQPPARRRFWAQARGRHGSRGRAYRQRGRKVKVVWTREEDIQHDVYRPVYRDTISATLSGGKIVGWKYRVSGSAVMARWFPAGFQNGVDIDGVDSAIDMPYDIPNFHVEFV